MSNLLGNKSAIEALVKRGDEMLADLEARHSDGSESKDAFGLFESSYQDWYTETSSVIEQILPDRLAEYQELYMGNPRAKANDYAQYGIRDWLLGVRSVENSRGSKVFNDFGAIVMRFQNQVDILSAVLLVFDSKLINIRQFIQAELFDSELESASELERQGFLRASGVVAGVVLEKHLRQVAANHRLTTRKKRPTISDFNDLLKNNDVLDVPPWRQIQRLGDIRNLCAHDNLREPTKDEVVELIAGVDKFTKTLF